MRRYELLRITIYVVVGLGLAYALHNTPIGGYIPDSIGRNMGRIVIGFVMLMMLAPLILLVRDISDWRKQGGSYVAALGRFTFSGIVGFIVAANMYLFFLLAFFFDGGAFPWGEISGARYWIDANMRETEVSESWFWFSYWQGLTAWAGAGIYGVGAFGFKFLKSIRDDQAKQALRDAGSILFVAAWLIFVLWEADRIVS